MSGAVPLAGSARKSARGAFEPPVGGPLLPGVPGVPVLPPLVAARTVMLCCRGVEDRPRASVTTRVTVNAPALVKRWVGLRSVLVNPSPKSQLEVIASPSASDEAFEKRTVSGAVPLVGSARKSARGALLCGGGGGAGGSGITVTSWVLGPETAPFESVTTRVTWNSPSVRKTCTGLVSVLVVPSPKSQAEVIVSPSAS